MAFMHQDMGRVIGVAQGGLRGLKPPTPILEGAKG